MNGHAVEQAIQHQDSTRLGSTASCVPLRRLSPIHRSTHPPRNSAYAVSRSWSPSESLDRREAKHKGVGNGGIAPIVAHHLLSKCLQDNEIAPHTQCGIHNPEIPALPPGGTTNNSSGGTCSFRKRRDARIS